MQRVGWARCALPIIRIRITLNRTLQEGMEKGLEKGKRDTERSIARALLDIIPDDALLAQRTGVPLAEIAVMRREASGKK